MRWVGEIQGPASETVTFSVTTDTGVKLSVGGETVINNFGMATGVFSGAVDMVAGEFYAIELEYIEDIDEAEVHLSWESASVPKTIVPSSALYYTRHVGNSPVEVMFYPGDVDADTTSAEGSGLTACVAMEECEFTIQAKDTHGNHIFNQGTDAWVLQLTGVDDWAGTGRTNDKADTSGMFYDVTNGSSIVYVPDVAPIDWEFLGFADVSHGSAYLYNTSADFITDGLLARGDTVMVGDEVFEVHATSMPFSSETVPLDGTYRGGFDAEARLLYDCYGSTTADCFAQRSYNHGYEHAGSVTVPVYKGGAGTTGTYLVTYTPYVRGTYRLDIKVPSTVEVQRLTTSVEDDSALSGTFNLTLTALGSDATGSVVVTETTSALPFDASVEEMEAALLEFTSIYEVEVNRTDCSVPAETCTWYVAFTGVHQEGPLDLLVGDIRTLGGNQAQLEIAKETDGVMAESIVSAPYTTVVDPHDTDAPYTTAYGRGLVAGTAGETASFTIQSKDAWGNDRRESQARDLYRVWAFYPAEAPDNSTGVEGAVTYLADGAYQVDYVPTRYAKHTVAVMKAEDLEVQVLNLTFNSKKEASGTFTLSLDGVESAPLAWDSSADDVSLALEDMANVASVEVSRFGMSASSVTADPKRPSDVYANSYIYSVTFTSAVGDVNPMTVNTTLSSGFGSITTAKEGTMAHIKCALGANYSSMEGPWVNPELIPEAQVVRIWQNDGTIHNSEYFKLNYNGHLTTKLYADSTPAQLKDALEALEGIGSVNVESAVNADIPGREWRIEFAPTDGSTFAHMTNYGDLPALTAEWNATMDCSLKIYAGGLGGVSQNGFAYQDGVSPFVADIQYTDVSDPHVTAVHQKSVAGFDGLDTGIFESQTTFTIEARDRFSNRVMEGPLTEKQIIETKSNGTLAGTFTVGFKGSSVELAYNAGPADLEAALESLPDIGAVTVTTESVKDDTGKTATATYGSNELTPSEDFSLLFEVGDWIRVGANESSMGYSGVFTIVEMETASPYTITLSSAYLGETDTAAPVFEQGFDMRGQRDGYQYVVEFDSNLGDLPALAIDGSNLRPGNHSAASNFNATATVTACEWYVGR